MVRVTSHPAPNTSHPPPYSSRSWFFPAPSTYSSRSGFYFLASRLLPLVIRIDSLGNELSTYAVDRCPAPLALSSHHAARPGKPSKTSFQHRRCRRRGV